MTKYYHTLGLGAQVVSYISADHDFLLTTKLKGDDCTYEEYLSKPEQLVKVMASNLLDMHSREYTGCPVKNRIKTYLKLVDKNYQAGKYDLQSFSDTWQFSSKEEAYALVQAKGHLLKNDTLIHGDYCLPNIILDNFSLSGFVDLGNGGVGDRHIDIFWAIWTLNYNLKTDQYRQLFIDCYGRDKVDEDLLRVVAACEVFG